MRDDYNAVWKEILDVYLPHGLEFLRPETFARSDWSKGFVSLKTQFPRLRLTGKWGSKHVDKLFRVTLRDGQTRTLYIHIELQRS